MNFNFGKLILEGGGYSMRQISLLFLLFAFLGGNVKAQAPQGFKYQAIIRDGGGFVIGNQQIGVRVSILKENPTGTTVYSESHTPTTSNKGLINLVIGNGSVISGIFSDIDWASDDFYVKIEVDMTGGTNYEEMGTSQLLSVPYALYAESSGDWKKSGNDMYFNTGQLGVGMEPQHAFNVKVGNSIMGFTENSKMSQLFVGNTAGGYAGLYLDGSNGDFTGSDYCRILQDESLDMNIETMYYAGDIRFLSKRAPSLSLEKESMRITSDGFVGIGTHAPKSLLHLKGTDYNSSRLIIERDYYGYGGSINFLTIKGQTIPKDVLTGGISFYGNDSTFTDPHVKLNVVTTEAHTATNRGAQFGIWTTPNGSKEVGSDPQFVVDHNGNIGIGTNQPEAKLEVTNGDVYVTDTNKGIILTAPDGSCYRVTVANDGNLVSTLITCP